MHKVKLVVHTSDVDAALDVVQKVGAVEFKPTERIEVVEPEVLFPHAQLLPRVLHAVQFLAPYAPERGLWQTLREGSRAELTESEVVKKMQDVDAVRLIVEDLERLQVEHAELTERVRELTEQHELLAEWKGLPIALSKLNTPRTKTLLVEGRAAAEGESVATQLERELAAAAVPSALTEVSATAVALTIANDSSARSAAEEVCSTVGVNIVTPPAGVETPEVEFIAISEQLAKAKGDLALWLDQAEHFAITHFHNLQVAGEVLSWQRDRYAVVDAAGATKYTVVFDGWLNGNRKVAIEAEFQKLGLAAVFTEVELAEDEEPPVEIENSNFVRPFEAVTRLYGMPGYKDLDPTVFLAGFFFLFFGLSLTDVGYGLFLMVASVIILTLFKVAKPIRQFAKLLLFVGFATVLVGALFGGYFGLAPEQLPEALQKLAVFDPIGNPLPVFYLALGLGVFQVMVGLMVKIYSEYKNNRLMDGVLDQGPWLFLFGIGILYVLQMVEYVDLLSTKQIINLAYVGVAMVAIFSARHGSGIFGKIQSAAGALYGSIGYFSDILSYSRLLALGLATTALAFAVNLIASMIFDKESIITWIFAGLVLLIGHVFTLAVNTLGAFIHSARLQFVEFFGKFIVGTGREFKPLMRSERHVIVVDDTK
ncbi:hypothetical protein H6778_03480 [Candidatus Nomurabacteria bacterium]|nr:hypothetical protein [Candidatus Nomurabacteria bacterium]